MTVRLNVPFFSQLGIGASPGNPGRDDPTGCWYACACMIGAFYEIGPRLGVPELFTRQLGGGRVGHRMLMDTTARTGTPDYFALFMEREHLAANPVSADPLMVFDAELIEDLLNRQGPILFFWMKTGRGSTIGHASVIIGVEGDDIIYHDPERAPGLRMSVSLFNSVRQKFRYGLLQRVPRSTR